VTLRCQVCAGPLSPPLLDLGYQPLCNQLIRSPEEPQVCYPLAVHRCAPCDLVQLGYVLPTERVFGDQFAYLTGTSPGAVKYFDALAKRLIASTGVRAGESVVDIGSGDGTFLRPFQAAGCEVLGVEGAMMPAQKALEAGIPTLPSFLGRDTAKRALARLESPIRLVTAMNVLAHTDRINEVCAELRALMNDGATLVIQNHWLGSLLHKAEFDTIYHEHLRYFSVGSLTKLLAKHGLYVYHAETTDYYGGSFVAFATTKPRTWSPSLMTIESTEPSGDLPLLFNLLARDLLSNRLRLVDWLTDARLDGDRILGVGAPMKATTLLNYYGIGRDLVEAVAETNQLKVGCAIPGTGIPIVDEAGLDLSQYGIALLLSWNWAEALMKSYRSRGFTGRFVIPCPTVRLIN
jgi:hypothetical protein